MIDDYAYELYKPLRNELKRYNLADVLLVCKAYSQVLTYPDQLKLPPGLEPMPDYLDMARGVHQWELEILAREAIINCSAIVYLPNSMRKAKNFQRTLYKERTLEEELGKIYLNQSNIMNEFHRLSQRQFVYQSDRANAEFFWRFYRLFSTPDMSNIINRVMGFNTDILYILGLLFTGTYINFAALRYPPSVTISKQLGISLETVDIFLKHFSLPIDELREKLISEKEREINENFAYYFDSLKVYPLIKMRHEGRMSLICPMPILLFWRFTNGIYYEIYKEPDFDNSFGPAFENYVGEVLSKIFTGTKFSFLPEETERASRGITSSDWYLYDSDSIMFIECKTKRMQLAAKIELNSRDKLTSQIEVLAEGIIQIYKAYENFKKNKFKKPKIIVSDKMQIYPVIITLEEWHLFGEGAKLLEETVSKQMLEKSLPVEWLDSMPYLMCSVAEFEVLLSVVKVKGSIRSVLHEKVNNTDLKRHQLFSYLQNNFKKELNEVEFIFQEEYDKTFPEDMENFKLLHS